MDSPPAIPESSLPSAPRAGLRSLLIASRRPLLQGAIESLLVLLGGCAAVFATYPYFWWLFRTHLWVRITDIYTAGDFGGTMYLLGRSLLGERGNSSTLLSYPEGFEFKGVFFNQVYTEIMSWFIRLFGLPVGYNLATLLTLASNAVAIHYAGRVLGARPLPAACGGFIGAVMPLVMEEVASGRNVTAWWAPTIFGIAACIHAFRSWRHLPLLLPGAASVCLGIAVYGYQPLLLAPWALLAGIFALWPLSRARLLRAAIVLVLGLAIVGLFARGYFEAGAGTLEIRPNYRQQSLSIPLLFSLHPDAHLLMRVPGTLIPLLLLGALVGIRRLRSYLPALVAAAILLAISLHTNLWESKENARIDLSTPYVWAFEHLRILWGCPRPLRYGIAGVLALALAWGPAWSAATSWIRWPWLRETACVLSFLGAMISVPVVTARYGYLEWPPLPALELMKGEKVLLDLPLEFKTDTTAMQMIGYAQVPRLNPPGQEIRSWRERLDVQTRPLLTAVTVIEDGQAPSQALIDQLRESIPERDLWGLRRVVVHLPAASPQQIADWSVFFEAIGASRLHSDTRLVVWELPPARAAQ